MFDYEISFFRLITKKSNFLGLVYSIPFPLVSCHSLLCSNLSLKFIFLGAESVRVFSVFSIGLVVSVTGGRTGAKIGLTIFFSVLFPVQISFLCFKSFISSNCVRFLWTIFTYLVKSCTCSFKTLLFSPSSSYNCFRENKK